MKAAFKQLEKIKLRLKHHASSFTAILFPAGCFSCGALLLEKDGLCHICWGKLSFFSPPWCDKCGHQGVPRVIKHACQSCIHHHRAYDKLRAGIKFNGTSKDLIHQFKYYDKTILASLLSRLALRSVTEFSDANIIIPVPIHNNKLKQRKYNQSSLLAKEIAKLIGKPVMVDLLKRVKDTQSQVGLTSNLRHNNVKDAFKVSPKYYTLLKGKNVILVDDVISTGATAHECSKSLKEAGASSVYVICVARNDITLEK